MTYHNLNLVICDTVKIMAIFD